MGRVNNNKRSTNYIGATYFIFVILLSGILIYMLIDFGKNFTEYQANQVTELKSEIAESLVSEDPSKLTTLGNKYSFELIVQKDQDVIYTSNALYDIDVADQVYNNNYIYKETYTEGEFVIWLVVTSVDFVAFANGYLFIILIGIAVVFISTIAFMAIIYKRISTPLLNVMVLIQKLRSEKTPQIDFNQQLDLVSNELLSLYNTIALRAYISDKNQAEYKRIGEVRKSVIDEQNLYLRTLIHDMKTPLAAINFSRVIIQNEQELSEDAQKALEHIKSQSESTLNLIVDSLENIADDTRTSFDAIDEIDVTQMIREYFDNNSLQLNQKYLQLKITDEPLFIFANRIKFLQIMNNILSNMLMYSKPHTALEIELDGSMLSFKNQIGNITNMYSTGVGQNTIDQYSKDLDIKFKVNATSQEYIITLDLRELYV